MLGCVSALRAHQPALGRGRRLRRLVLHLYLSGPRPDRSYPLHRLGIGYRWLAALPRRRLHQAPRLLLHRGPHPDPADSPNHPLAHAAHAGPLRHRRRQRRAWHAYLRALAALHAALGHDDVRRPRLLQHPRLHLRLRSRPAGDPRPRHHPLALLRRSGQRDLRHLAPDLLARRPHPRPQHTLSSALASRRLPIRSHRHGSRVRLRLRHPALVQYAALRSTRAGVPSLPSIYGHGSFSASTTYGHCS